MKITGTHLVFRGALIGVLSALAVVGCADEPFAPNIAPVVIIDAPAPGSSVTGAVDLAASVTDDKSVAKVSFIVDGEVVGTDSEAPYEAVWMAPGDGALHSVNVEATDSDGAVTNQVVRVRTAQGVTVLVTNNLLFPINITLNGVVIGSVPPESIAQKNVGKLDTLDLRWSLARTTTTEGTAVGDHMGGVFPVINVTGPAQSFDVDNVITDLDNPGQLATYMVPVVTNTTSANFLMAANVGLPFENRCECVVPANASDIAIGYYRLPPGGNVRGYLDGSSYTGGFIYWNEGDQFTINDLQPLSGRINLLANRLPAARRDDPSGAIRSMAPSPIRRVPVTHTDDRFWNSPAVLQAPPLPRR